MAEIIRSLFCNYLQEMALEGCQWVLILKKCNPLSSARPPEPEGPSKRSNKLSLNKAIHTPEKSSSKGSTREVAEKDM
jgi:hypothetical protein